MDQTISTETHGTHVLRLVLIFFGAVLGFLVLGMALGSPSARADDGGGSSDSLGSAVGGLLSEVTKPVQATVTGVSHTVRHVVVSVPAAAPVTRVTHSVLPAAPASTVTAPVAAAADTAITALVGDSPLAAVLGDAPVHSILGPVVSLVDTAVDDAEAAVAPVLDSPAATADVTGDPVLSQASTQFATTASALVSGIAAGALRAGHDLGGLQPGALTDQSPSGSGLLAAVAGSGIFVLLAIRRHDLTSRRMPGSPVFATDSSPD